MLFASRVAGKHLPTPSVTCQLKLKEKEKNGYTVKLGYNELGYNEHSVITNKMFSPKGPFYYTKQPGYNEPRL